MAFDIGFYWDENKEVAMVPMTLEATQFFIDTFEMPEDCDALDVTKYDPMSVIELLPKKWTYGNTKKVPKKIGNYLFYTT